MHTPILIALGAITTFGSTFSYFPDAIQPRFGYGMLLQWLQKSAPGLHPCGQMEEGSRAAELPSEAHVLGQGGGILLNVLLAPKASPSGVWEVVKSTTKKVLLVVHLAPKAR